MTSTPSLAAISSALERLRAAIHRNDQARAALRDPHQRLAARAVALHQPVGDIGPGIEAELPQQPDQQRRGGRPVHVIVAEDRDRLAALYRIRQPFCRAVHVAEDRGIGA